MADREARAAEEQEAAQLAQALAASLEQHQAETRERALLAEVLRESPPKPAGAPTPPPRHAHTLSPEEQEHRDMEEAVRQSLQQQQPPPRGAPSREAAQEARDLAAASRASLAQGGARPPPREAAEAEGGSFSPATAAAVLAASAAEARAAEDRAEQEQRAYECAIAASLRPKQHSFDLAVAPKKFGILVGEKWAHVVGIVNRLGGPRAVAITAKEKGGSTLTVSATTLDKLEKAIDELVQRMSLFDNDRGPPAEAHGRVGGGGGGGGGGGALAFAVEGAPPPKALALPASRGHRHIFVDHSNLFINAKWPQGTTKEQAFNGSVVKDQALQLRISALCTLLDAGGAGAAGAAAAAAAAVVDKRYVVGSSPPPHQPRVGPVRSAGVRGQGPPPPHQQQQQQHWGGRHAGRGGHGGGHRGARQRPHLPERGHHEGGCPREEHPSAGHGGWRAA